MDADSTTPVMDTAPATSNQALVEKVVAEEEPVAEEVPAAKEEEPVAEEAAAPAEEAMTGRRSTRDRKVREVYKPVEKAEDEVKELMVPDGEGEELGLIENVNHRLGTTLSTAPILQKIHGLLFPKQRSVKKDRKANIRRFKGFDKANLDAAKETATTKLDSYTLDDLKGMCLFFDIEKTGIKGVVVERICDFLVSPVSSGNAYQKGSRGTAKKASKKKGKKRAAAKDKVAKPLTGYMYFSTQKSPGIRATCEGVGMGEVSKKVGLLWSKFDDDEKAVWKQKSIAAFEANGCQPAKKKAKKAKAKQADSDDSSDDEPLVAQKGLGQDMEAKLKSILTESDLSVVTRKMIRKKLQKDFDSDLVKDKKAEIKEFIDAFLSSTRD